MNILFSLFSVLVLVLVAYVGIENLGLQTLFGIVIPYIAVAIFLVGVIYRVILWAKSPVPFRIPTTSGQEKSHPWIKSNSIDNPSNLLGVLARMALEVLAFRSLLKNTKNDLQLGPNGPKVGYGGFAFLWLMGLVFHYSLLIIVVRHFRFFTEPIPFFLPWMEALDGLMTIGIPTLYMTDIGVLLAVSYLFIRRVIVPQIRYISLPADYFPLLLIAGIALSGVLMRHFFKVDLLKVKEFSLGLTSLSPVNVQGIGVPFYIHLFLISTLGAYLPFSKLMHMAGVFLSPTRNLINNNRMRRHINPWNHPVKTHPYEEYEDEFRDKMIEAGLPVDKES